MTAAYADRPPRSRLLRAVLLPLLGALLLTAVVVVYDGLRPPQYTSEALVAVLPDDPAVNVSSPLTAIWVQIGNSDVVLNGVAEDLRVSRSSLSGGLTVAESADAPLISIQASTGDAEVSAEWANSAAGELLSQAQISRVPGYFLQQVAEAQPAQSADRSTTVLLIAGAAVLGALIGASAAQLLAARDRRRRSAAVTLLAG